MESCTTEPNKLRQALYSMDTAIVTGPTIQKQQKSSIGFVFTLAGGAVLRMSQRQSIVALSTVEAGDGAAYEDTMEAVAESTY